MGFIGLRIYHGELAMQTWHFRFAIYQLISISHSPVLPLELFAPTNRLHVIQWFTSCQQYIRIPGR